MRSTTVQQLLQDMSHDTEELLLHRFLSASRADVKLACAILSLRSGLLQEPYEKYVMSRLRPAVTELIFSQNIAGLEVLDSCGVFTAALTDEYLKTASECGATECAVWFLVRKARRFGFRDRTFDL